MNQPRLALVDFVARRYSHLQGFRTATDGLCLLAFSAYMRWVEFDASAAILFLPLSLWCRHGLGRYYDTRFGRAGSRAGSPDDKAPALFIYVAVKVGALMLAWPLGNPERTALVVGLLATAPLAILRRDWPYRAHWVLPLLVGLGCGLAFAGVTAEFERLQWAAMLFAATGLSLVVAGLLDHSLLVKAMQPAPECSQPETAR
jgi:hypothetical protein